MAKRATILKARQLRRAMTKPEIALWDVLRARPAGVKFRRQHPIGPFVLDFYCPSAKLAVEVDGMAHDMGDRPARDEHRDAWLRAHGIEVLRLPAREVLADLDAVLRFLVHRCADPSTSLTAGPPPHASHRED